MAPDRPLLLARLTAERTHLLHPLIGLTEAQLTTIPVSAEWTAANLLAHIGDWDQFFTKRIEMVLEGRVVEIEEIDSADERNPAVYERIKGLTLAGSVEVMRSARTAFLAVLRQVDDQMLSRFQDVPWGKVKISTWVGWRGWHDYHHAKDIRKWKKKLRAGGASSSVTGPSALMVAALDAASEDLNASAELVLKSNQPQRQVAGAWTLADIYGHLADWTHYFLCNLRDGDPASYMGDEETFNIRKAAARQGQPLSEVRAEFSEMHQVLVWTLEETSEAHWQAQPQSKASPYPTVYHCAWSALEHLLDHAAGIRGGLGLGWPKRLLHVNGPYI